MKTTIKKYVIIATIFFAFSVSIFFNFTGVLRADEVHWLVTMQEERVNSAEVRKSNRETINKLEAENKERENSEKCMMYRIEQNNKDASCEGL